MFVSKQSPHLSVACLLMAVLRWEVSGQNSVWTLFWNLYLGALSWKTVLLLDLLSWKVYEVLSGVCEVSQLITLATVWKPREKVYGLLQFMFINYPYCNSSASYLSFCRQSHKPRKEILQCWFPQPNIVGLMQVLLTGILWILYDIWHENFFGSRPLCHFKAK